MMVKTTRQSGKQAEDITAIYLTQRKIKVINRNFHCRFGEIDLIGLDDDILIFFEVRYRKNDYFLSAVETIDQHKCKKIVMTSEYYLNKHKKYQSHFCRYDVIAISGALEQPVIKWIKNAFQA